MPINLKSTSGGGITLSAAPTAVDLTVTVPATNGTLVTTGGLSDSSGASLVGYLPAGTGAVATTVQGKLRLHDQQLLNIDGNLNFSTLELASSPVADADLMILRQGSSNKKLPASTFRAEFSTTAVAASVVATDAKVAAEAARDAALIQAGVYTTEALGRAAVADGVAFKVQGSGDVAAYEYRRVSAGVVSTLIATYPASSAVTFRTETNGALLAVADTDGNLAVNIKTPLVVDEIGSIDTTANNISKRDLNNKLAWADADGNLVLAVDRQGQLVANFALVPNVTLKTGGTYDYNVNHVFGYGQSLSVGQATPAISTTQRYDNLMFYRGMRPQYDYPVEANSVWYGSLVPAVEALSPANAALAETPSTGTGDMVKQLILSEDGLSYSSMSYQMLLSTPGYGAQTISQLSKGGAHYTRITTQATYGLSLANAASKTYAVQAITWTQGESDYLSGTSRATYLSLLNQFVSDANTDLKAITGQVKSVNVIAYQLASHKVGGSSTPTIALALTDAAAANALVHIACPMYHFEYQDSNNFHLTSVSSRWLGAYYGLAYKRIVIDGVAWKPVQPISSIKQGAIANVKFNVPHGRLTLDTTLVSANTNYGFELVDSGGSALTINSVSITGPDTVKVVAAATIPAGAKLRYAWSGSGNVGSTVGPRGNLRDSQGDAIVFDPTGINKPMHNWCVIFELSL